jgi:hypothetical protein
MKWYFWIMDALLGNGKPVKIHKSVGLTNREKNLLFPHHKKGKI